MYDQMEDNQRFIDAAKGRGEDVLMYLHPKTAETILVSGSPQSVAMLGKMIDDYELAVQVVDELGQALSETSANAEMAEERA
ncbi:hypothetical protein [Acidithiobacillus sulfurivorans]|uniref:Uncharacterized protein n=1 Tax=Acidithiobacillus sulfurivorans TaxID=1958756 RepID=A0ABS5ZY63_9PROT|nr:hypothetical protein [Acidithiobacillus sulfurivorans]MBU2759950.1 hypothetical protein [Acidithiobacillus sulfurivorans]